MCRVCQPYVVCARGVCQRNVATTPPVAFECAVLYDARRRDVRVFGRQVPNLSFHVNVDMVAMAPVLRSAALVFLDAGAKASPGVPCTEWIRRVRVLAGVAQ